MTRSGPPPNVHVVCTRCGTPYVTSKDGFARAMCACPVCRSPYAQLTEVYDVVLGDRDAETRGGMLDGPGVDPEARADWEPDPDAWRG